MTQVSVSAVHASPVSLQSLDPSPGGCDPFLPLSLCLPSSAHMVHSDTTCHVNETPDGRATERVGQQYCPLWVRQVYSGSTGQDNSLPT